MRSEIAKLSKMLSSTEWPRGAATLPGIGDADVDLAEFDGFVAGLAASYIRNAPLRVKRIALSRRLAAAFDRTLPSKQDDAILEPYRREWKLLVELSEALAKTGKLDVEWTD